MQTKFEVSSFSRSGDIRGSQNLKVGHVTHPLTSFDLICKFFRQGPLHTKFEVSSFSRSKDIRGRKI